MTDMRIAMLTAPKCAGKTYLARELASAGVCQLFHSDSAVIERLKKELRREDATFDQFLPQLKANVARISVLHEPILQAGQNVLAEGLLYCYSEFRNALYSSVGTAKTLLVELRPALDEMTRGLRARNQQRSPNKSLADWERRFEPPNGDELRRLGAYCVTANYSEAVTCLGHFFGS
jgi:tRNA uridine 5-carbamoylmethylation protein Kti12